MAGKAKRDQIELYQLHALNRIVSAIQQSNSDGGDSSEVATESTLTELKSLLETANQSLSVLQSTVAGAYAVPSFHAKVLTKGDIEGALTVTSDGNGGEVITVNNDYFLTIPLGATKVSIVNYGHKPMTLAIMRERNEMMEWVPNADLLTLEPGEVLNAFDDYTTPYIKVGFVAITDDTYAPAISNDAADIKTMWEDYTTDPSFSNYSSDQAMLKVTFKHDSVPTRTL